MFCGGIVQCKVTVQIFFFLFDHELLLMVLIVCFSLFFPLKTNYFVVKVNRSFLKVLVKLSLRRFSIKVQAGAAVRSGAFFWLEVQVQMCVSKVSQDKSVHLIA